MRAGSEALVPFRSRRCTCIALDESSVCHGLPQTCGAVYDEDNEQANTHRHSSIAWEALAGARSAEQVAALHISRVASNHESFAWQNLCQIAMLMSTDIVQPTRHGRRQDVACFPQSAAKRRLGSDDLLQTCLLSPDPGRSPGTGRLDRQQGIPAPLHTHRHRFADTACWSRDIHLYAQTANRHISTREG